MQYPENFINKVILGDCLDIMPGIPDKSIDMVLCDLPYGTTACKWDVIIPFKALWEQYERIIKDNKAIVLFGNQPFITDLINSNRKLFKYSMVWDKVKTSQPHLSKIKPMQRHEDILIFGNKRLIYNPIMIKKGVPRKAGGKRTCKNNEHKLGLKSTSCYLLTHSYPSTIIVASNANNKFRVHSTQKPVALFEYLIKTYTNENDIVLDNCAGSGTTGIACINTNRNYILIEKNEKYFDTCVNIINKHKEILNSQFFK